MSVFDDISNILAKRQQQVAFMADEMTPYLAEAAELLIDTLLNGGKIITLGSTDCELLAEWFSRSLVHPAGFDRPSLASIHLPYKHNTFSGTSCWEQQLSIHAQPADTLMIMAGVNNPEEIKKLIRDAGNLDCQVVGLIADRSLSSIFSSQHTLIPHADPSGQLPFDLLANLISLIEKRLFFLEPE